MRKQVLIVEDHEHLAVALALVLDGDLRFRTCGVAADIPEAIALMPDAGADLVILDINLPSGSGLDLIPILRTANPAAQYLVFSRQEEAVYAPLARRAGAHGYLRKGASPRAILEVASTIVGGGRHFPGIRED